MNPRLGKQDNINQLMENIDEKTQDVVAQTRLIEDKDTKENKLTELMDLERQLEAVRKQLEKSNSTKTMMNVPPASNL